ncbi:hypothetical protein [Geomesophilobacter sediminis]|uniref:Uncharacterized protein n=1 Tax=Geomesophilobacter sediminis TaxID=2798584 RepID=A0A8J7M0J5_9BACT|nr:hypothetical protein [Geomesophilobacter sediminis]MBJ6725517.1 hypothetical protein [Geomesophilobacter sediminis]
MMCSFNDGLKVSYCGPLRIKKEGAIDVFLDDHEIPDDIHGELIEAVLSNNCSDMRRIADIVTEQCGKKLPELETQLPETWVAWAHD